MTNRPVSHLREIWEDLRLGTLSRREFVARAAALGVAGPVILAAVNDAHRKVDEDLASKMGGLMPGLR